jgi:hypothetical protein
VTDAPSLQLLSSQRMRHAAHNSEASPAQPAALSVRRGFFSRRRIVVPVEAIALIDDATRVIGLRIARAPALLGPAKGGKFMKTLSALLSRIRAALKA